MLVVIINIIPVVVILVLLGHIVEIVDRARFRETRENGRFRVNINYTQVFIALWNIDPSIKYSRLVITYKLLRVTGDRISLKYSVVL